MVDVQPKSSKLRDRAVRIVVELCGIESEAAIKLLESSGWNVKASILMNNKNIGLREATILLEEHGGFLKKALL